MSDPFHLATDQAARITELTDRIAALEAQLAEREWRPIETAPKDGTIILLGGGTDDELREVKRAMAASWFMARTGYEGFWNAVCAEAGFSVSPYRNPTHWQPLPPLPKEAP